MHKQKKKSSKKKKPIREKTVGSYHHRQIQCDTLKSYFCNACNLCVLQQSHTAARLFSITGSSN